MWTSKYLDVLVALEQITQEANEQIGIDSALVRFVNDDMTDALEIRIATQSTEDHTGGTEQEAGIGPTSLLASDGVTYSARRDVEIFHALLGDSGGDSHCCDSTGLSDDNGRIGPAALLDLVVQNELG